VQRLKETRLQSIVNAQAEDSAEFRRRHFVALLQPVQHSERFEKRGTKKFANKN